MIQRNGMGREVGGGFRMGNKKKKEKKKKERESDSEQVQPEQRRMG